MPIKARELRQLYESLGPEECCGHLREALAQKHLKPDDFSVRDLFESLIENGRELLRAISPGKGGGVRLMEAAAAVDTTAFSNITGQIVYSRILEKYEDPAFLWPELCETIPTTFLDGERIPGVGRMGDKAEIVDEAQPYPTVGLTEEYIDTAPTRKRGFIVPVTREIIVADRTGVLLKNAGEVGYWLGLNKEKRVLDLAFGVTNNYKRNGTALNTYLTSGAYVNSQANALADWKSVESAELLFDAITDPNTGEPVSIMPDTIIVPSALRRTALRILNATEVAQVDNQANASTVRTFGKNPLTGSTYKVLSSPQVKARTGSSSTWFQGQPKRAFGYMEVWGIETLQAASNSEAEFLNDIMMRFKVSERGSAQVMNPRFMSKNT